jgi:uncharacterized protein
MPMFGMFIDPTYLIIVGPTILIALWAQMKVKSAYGKYSRVANSRGLSGAEAAAELLRREGGGDVRIEATKGWLSDHYDPKSRTLRLSPDVHNGRSVAAVGIAAHEAGHALQHAQNYAFLGMRSALVPVAGIGSWLSFPLIFIGFFLHSADLVGVGVITFAAVVAFQFITLPVEFNASSRAKEALQRHGLLRAEELTGVNKVLGAAAMTYVAATLTALAQLFYFVLLFSGVSRD